MIRPYAPYTHIPAPLPRLADAVGRSLCEWAVGPSDRPLGLERVVAEDRPEGQHLVLHTDLIVGAWRQLFPAERMLIIGGRRQGARVHATSLRDVTGDNHSRAYVKASPVRLHEALMDWESTGAHVVAWIHSHPGMGPLASHPSDIDRRQDLEWSATYGNHVLGMIATQDGWLRLWGKAIERPDFHVDLQGRGIVRTEASHVYRLAVR